MNFSVTIGLLMVAACINYTFSQDTISVTSNPKGRLFSFGIVSDAQYVDADKVGKRDYRQSLIKLENSINTFNRHDLSFVANLGDLIDREYNSFEKVKPILDASKAEVYNVLGNHDFSVEETDKSNVRNLLNNKKGYFEFEIADFRFLVLDGSDVSLFAHNLNSEKYRIASVAYEKLKSENANNAETWNGGIGRKQLNWLRKRINAAEKKGKKVIVFCHWPLLPANGAQLWNSAEVLEVLDGSPAVVAWISGHHHPGNYINHSNVHHLTIKGLVEAESSTSCGIVDVYPDRLLVNGYGDQDSLILRFNVSQL